MDGTLTKEGITADLEAMRQRVPRRNLGSRAVTQPGKAPAAVASMERSLTPGTHSLNYGERTLGIVICVGIGSGYNPADYLPRASSGSTARSLVDSGAMEATLETSGPAGWWPTPTVPSGCAAPSSVTTGFACWCAGDGEPTYLLPDIAYHHDKFSRGFDLFIDVWGADHHGYVPAA